MVLATLTGSRARLEAARQVAAVFYVAPTGDDGQAGSEAAPFRTLERARTAARALTAGMTGDIVVYLRGGVYPLTTTVTFDAADSGLNGFHVIYAAYPGETPVLSGGQRLTNWTAAGGNLYRAPASRWTSTWRATRVTRAGSRAGTT